jgi:hypothetical protein
MWATQLAGVNSAQSRDPFLGFPFDERAMLFLRSAGIDGSPPGLQRPADR